MTRTPPALVNVRFRVPFDRKTLVEAFTSDAADIAKLPNLRWKIWTFDDEAREFASFCLFDDLRSARAFVDGPVIRGIRADPNATDVRVEVHEVLESLTRTTRGPVG